MPAGTIQTSAGESSRSQEEVNGSQERVFTAQEELIHPQETLFLHGRYDSHRGVIYFSRGDHRDLTQKELQWS